MNSEKEKTANLQSKALSYDNLTPEEKELFDEIKKHVNWCYESAITEPVVARLAQISKSIICAGDAGRLMWPSRAASIKQGINIEELPHVTVYINPDRFKQIEVIVKLPEALFPLQDRFDIRDDHVIDWDHAIEIDLHADNFETMGQAIGLGSPAVLTIHDYVEGE